jgi:hypothetical protein
VHLLFAFIETGSGRHLWVDSSNWFPSIYVESGCEVVLACARKTVDFDRAVDGNLPSLEHQLTGQKNVLEARGEGLLRPTAW